MSAEIVLFYGLIAMIGSMTGYVFVASMGFRF